MDEPTRRDFLESAAWAAVPAVGLAATAQAVAQEPNANAETARLLTEMLRARYGKQLSEEQFKSLRQKIAGQLVSADALKRIALRNSDEPDFVFFAEP